MRLIRHLATGRHRASTQEGSGVSAVVSPDSQIYNFSTTIQLSGYNEQI